jgi:hypothetical protein
MWVFRRAILEHMKLESDGMAFSEEIKIEALRDSRMRFGEISIMYTSRMGENQAESLARRLREPGCFWSRSGSGDERQRSHRRDTGVPVWNRRELLERLL